MKVFWRHALTWFFSKSLELQRNGAGHLSRVVYIHICPCPRFFFFLFAVIYIYGTRVQSTCYSCIKGILSEKFPFEKNPSSKIGFKRKLLLLLKKNNTFMKLKDVRFQIIHGQRSAVSPFVFRPQDKKQ